MVLIKVAVVAAAFAAAPLLLSAVAHAEPDPNAAPLVDPAALCASPDVGGVFIAAPAAPDGVARSECQYIVEGYFYYDNYENGAYTGTLVYKDGAKVPTERPVIPENFTMPGGGPAPTFVFPGQF